MTWHSEKRALHNARKEANKVEEADDVTIETHGRPGAQYDHPQLRIRLDAAGTGPLRDVIATDNVYIHFVQILGKNTDDSTLDIVLKHVDAKGDA